MPSECNLSSSAQSGSLVGYYEATIEARYLYARVISSAFQLDTEIVRQEVPQGPQIRSLRRISLLISGMRWSDIDTAGCSFDW